jgi:16S rRNA (cytidine1402-2'-O)-methyltransferase
MPGTLFIVATPIGNLEDITYRAVRVLGQAGRIACEDTRQTRKLLEHYGIRTPLVSYHDHNERARAAELLAQLEAGGSIALVTDAGTPLVSDPGFRLVEQAAARGIPVVPIPGPCAVVTAFSAAGLPCETFRFGGFLPPKQGQRRKAIEAVRGAAETVAFYEAPHRIVETLADIEELLEPGRPVVAARELTKLHEEFLRGAAGEVRRALEARPAVKGEFTLLIGPAPTGVPPAEADPDPRAEVEALLAAGVPRMDAIKQVAQRRGVGKREIYRLVEGERQ